MTETDAELDASYDLVVSFDLLVINRAGFLVPLFNAFDKTFLYSKAPPPLEDARVQIVLFVLAYAIF
jgi:hypothetical protein